MDWVAVFLAIPIPVFWFSVLFKKKRAKNSKACRAALLRVPCSLGPVEALGPFRPMDWLELETPTPAIPLMFCGHLTEPKNPLPQHMFRVQITELGRFSFAWTAQDQWTRTGKCNTLQHLLTSKPRWQRQGNFELLWRSDIAVSPSACQLHPPKCSSCSAVPLLQDMIID